MKCTKCLSENIIKYGHTHYGKPRFRCKDCGRQFVENASRQPVSQDTRNLIDKLLLERLSLRAIQRVTKVSLSWLQIYVNQKYQELNKEVEVTEKKEGPRKIQIDELWSFVTDKGKKYWVWLAIDVETREIVGVYIGDRSEKSARKLWESLPAVYRKCAVCYTDYWQSYQGVLPKKRHKAVGKETGLTSYIERFNNTLRQRVGRLVRKSLSFSKKVENHIGAIWYFIHHYNSEIRDLTLP